MKRYAGLMLILCAPFVTFSAASHPYDTALEFREHKTDDGRPIYTNIPKKCFSKGRLTCIQLHPIFKGPGTIKDPASEPKPADG